MTTSDGSGFSQERTVLTIPSVVPHLFFCLFYSGLPSVLYSIPHLFYCCTVYFTADFHQYYSLYLTYFTVVLFILQRTSISIIFYTSPILLLYRLFYSGLPPVLYSIPHLFYCCTVYFTADFHQYYILHVAYFTVVLFYSGLP